MTDATNPLLEPSSLPYGLPDYRAIRPAHYLPAYAGNLDIMTSAALATADTWAGRTLEREAA